MKKEGRKILLLDTGNLLFRKPPQTETKRRDALLRVDLLIQSYNEMGYEVVNVGEKDLMMGLKFLSEVSQKAKLNGYKIFTPLDRREAPSNGVQHLENQIRDFSLPIRKSCSNKSLSSPFYLLL